MDKQQSMKLLKFIIPVFIFFAACNNTILQTPYSFKNNDGAKISSSISVLDHMLSSNTADSLLIQQELKRLLSRYKYITDSLKQNAPDSVYADFAVHRYINLSYRAHNFNALKYYHDSLIYLAAAYPLYIDQNKGLSEDIAKCIVNSFEGVMLNEDTIIEYVSGFINRYINNVYGKDASIVQKKNILDTYAAQYAARGIISMAEPLFHKFKAIYLIENPEAKPIVFNQDYLIYNQDNKPISNISNSKNSWSVFVFMPKQTNFDLVYLISIIRATNKLNTSIPILIAREPLQFNDSVIRGVRASVSGAFGYFDLDSIDISYYAYAPKYIVQRSDGSFAYSGNNAIAFLEWLQAPFEEQRKAAKIKSQELQLALQLRKDSIARLPLDTTLKLQRNFGNIKVLLNGYWPKDVQLSMRVFGFNDIVDYEHAGKGISQIVVSDKQGNTLFNQWIIKPIKQYSAILKLTANKGHDITVLFSDKLNAQAYQQMIALAEIQRQISVYQSAIEEYPYQSSKFIEQIKEYKTVTEIHIDSMLHVTSIASQTSALLGMAQLIYRFQNIKQAQTINYKSLDSMMNIPRFDSVLYNSPFYTNAINYCITYDESNIKSSINYILGSPRWAPDKYYSKVARYIWRQMNKIGREDMMVYIDTTFLASCSSDDTDVQKRIAGYKRMAIGNKAPNIIWTHNKQKESLNKITADTIYIIFWADWCGHCKEFLLGFYQKISAFPNTEVIAVNIDDDNSSTDLGNNVFPLWHHVQAKGKWKDKIVDDYNVFGTPTIYMLNMNKEIVMRVY